MNDLSKLVGDFLFTFNEIEAQTYLILEALPNDNLVKYCKNLDQFKNRSRFLQALLRSSDIDERDALIDLLEQAISLSTFRNKLAHNPIRVDVFMRPDGELLTENQLYNSKNGEQIKQVIEQLPSQSNKLTNIAIGLLKITSSFSNDA